jgi:uncharacterized membrane protein
MQAESPGTEVPGGDAPPSPLLNEAGVLSPRGMEAILSALLAVVLGLSGFLLPPMALAIELCGLSLAGLVGVLLAEKRARRRWSVR